MKQHFYPMLLDLKGLVTNSFHASMSRQPITGTIKQDINTAEHGFHSFLTKFFDPMMDVVGSPRHVIAVLDDGHQIRKAAYSPYKAKRPEIKAKLDPLENEQLEMAYRYASRFILAIGGTTVRLKNQEADDIIAYLTNTLAPHVPLTISTIDKDLLQLADRANIFRNGEYVTEFKPNVPFDLIPLYLSILGDTSDGFPGVAGMGPKAWENLFLELGADGLRQVAKLLADKNKRDFRVLAEKSHNKELPKLISVWDEWQTQYFLACLHPEICETATSSLDWQKRCPLLPELEALFTEAGVLDLLPNYAKFCTTSTLVTQHNCEAVLSRMSKVLEDTPFVSFDYESYDPNPNKAHLEITKGRTYINKMQHVPTGCSFNFGDNLQHTVYFSVGHKDTDNLPLTVLTRVFDMVENAGLDLVAHNVDFEGTLTRLNLGRELHSWQDTRTYSHHLDEDGDNSLKDLSNRYLRYKQQTYDEVIASVEGAVTMADLSGHDTLMYAADDSMVTAHLQWFFLLRTLLEGTFDFCYEYEGDAVDMLSRPYCHGVKLDVDKMAELTAADEETCRVHLEKAKQIMAEYCKKPDYDAIERYYADQSNYVAYKAKRDLAKSKPGSTPQQYMDHVSAKLKEFKDALFTNSVYVVPYEVPIPSPFTPTPALLTKVAAKIGLPALTKTTKAALSDYLESTEAFNEQQETFLVLLRDAIPCFKARQGEAYEALRAFSDNLLLEGKTTKVEGTVLNLDSSTQIRYIMYLMLGLPVRIRTKPAMKSIRREAGLPGAPASDDSAIDFALANDCAGDDSWKGDLLRTISTYAKASTRLSNYWKPYPLWMDENHMLHPGYLTPGTVTRRPSGSNPNLLQVSKGNVRKCFIPRSSDNVIVSVDFASQELRVLASVTGDKNFLSAYIHPEGEADKDLHTMTGCGIAPALARRYPGDLLAQLQLDENGKVDYEWYLSQLQFLSDVEQGKVQAERGQVSVAKFLKFVRGVSKTVNFGAGYGGTAQTVSIQAMIPLEDAETAVDGMMRTYPGILTWKAKVYAFARKHGYVATTYGSRRHCGNGLNTGANSAKSRWERQLANFLIQGQCGDLLKVVLKGAKKTRLFEETGSFLIAAVYDEILSEVPKANVYEYLHRLADIMEIKMPGIVVPMVADCSFGPSWGTQIEVGVRPTRERIESVLADLA